MQNFLKKGFEHSLWHSFPVPLPLMQHGLVSPNFQETKEIKYCSVKTEVPLGSRWGGFWSSPLSCTVLFFFSFSILHLHFKKLSLWGGEEGKQKLTFVKRLRLGSCVEVTVLSQCQPPFPRVVSCNVFIYHYRRPKFFFPLSVCSVQGRRVPTEINSIPAVMKQLVKSWIRC